MRLLLMRHNAVVRAETGMQGRAADEGGAAKLFSDWGADPTGNCDCSDVGTPNTPDFYNCFRKKANLGGCKSNGKKGSGKCKGGALIPPTCTPPAPPACA